MKIKKNGQVIRLTESDLKRIVKRTLNEQDDVFIPPSEEENDVKGLKECNDSTLQKVIKSMKDMNSENQITIKTSKSHNRVLIIEHPSGKCGCLKKQFFELV